MLEKFIEEWFPKTIGWDNVGKFILESGIQMTKEQNPKWLTGYTNIGRSYKPHHKDEYIRYMEEGMFMLHDTIHQIFTLEVNCSEEEYVKRQIYGELFTFYLTEYVIPKTWKNYSYREERGCYKLMGIIIDYKWNSVKNIIDFMWDIFINEIYSDKYFINYLNQRGVLDIFEKYSKMFKEDL